MDSIADKAATPLGVLMSVVGAVTFEMWVMGAGIALTALSVWLRHRHNVRVDAHHARMEAINRERLELERRR